MDEPGGKLDNLRKFPLITVLLILVNVAVFVPRFLWGSDVYGELMAPYLYYPSHPDARGMLCSMFVHLSGLHLVGNMFFLWFFGVALERRTGKLAYLFIYLASGVATTALHSLVWEAYMPEGARMGVAGAFGPVAGVMGAFLCRCYFRRNTVVPASWMVLPAWVRVRAWVMVLLFFTLNALWGILQWRGGAIYIPQWALAGGMLSGFLIALVLGYRKYGKIEAYRELGLESMKDPHRLGIAEGAFEKILQLEPKDIQAMEKLGELHSRLRPTQRGEAHLRNAVNRCIEDGDPRRAAHIYTKYLTRYKGAFPARVQMELTRQLIAMNKINLAATGLEYWLEANPSSSSRAGVAKMLAGIYGKMGRPELAEKVMARVSTQSSRSAN